MAPVNFDKIDWFARRAKLAYMTAAEIQQQLPTVNRVVQLSDIDVQYFVEDIQENNAQLISIRGTANIKNAKEDADFIKAKDGLLDIYVHQGFDRDALAIYHDVKPFLDVSRPVITTGHSLGAAIAALVMLYLQHDGFTCLPSVNFGQPKFTNHAGVSRYQQLPLLRIVDKDDLVPLVPPKNLLDIVHGVYEHLGQEVILLRDNYYVLLEEPKAETLSIDDFWRNIGHEKVTDHYMDNYLKRIIEKLKNAKKVPYKNRHQYD